MRSATCPRPSASADGVSSDELEDACARLDHVVVTTEQASHRTLDLADRCRALTDTLKTAGPLDQAQAQAVTELRANLSELVLAQSYQDLTGQIIRRVATILRRLNENFASLGLKPHAEPAESGKGASDLAGPAVANLDHDAFSRTMPTNCSPAWVSDPTCVTNPPRRPPEPAHERRDPGNRRRLPGRGAGNRRPARRATGRTGTRPEDADQLNAVFRGFHTLKGGAGFLGIQPMVHLCHAAEDSLGAVRSGQVHMSARHFDAAQQALDYLQQMIDAVGAGTEPDDAPAELIAQFDVTGNASPAPAALPPTPMPAAPAAAAAPASGGGELITEDEFEALLDQLHGPAPHAATPAAAKPASGDITEDEFEALLDQLHGPVKHAAPKPAAAPAAPPPPPAPKPAAKPATTPARPAEAETTVRVDTKRLDAIVNLVGELVLSRNRLKTLRTRIQDEELHRAVSNLDIATARLQSAVMRTRMQPVSKVFRASPRWRATWPVRCPGSGPGAGRRRNRAGPQSGRGAQRSAGAPGPQRHRPRRRTAQRARERRQAAARPRAPVGPAGRRLRHHRDPRRRRRHRP
jgi:HPt (histidine-containing phosphotransfer) domain-containing protein